MLKKIGVLTSGGDSSGMNAAVRAVVRSGIASGMEVCGISDGYLGLCQGRITLMQPHDVSDILNRGGTILGTSRFPAFKEESVREAGIAQLRKFGIEGLIVIGGNGSYQGARLLSEAGMPCIGVPGTIDNDTPGSDFSIGFSTALSTVVECIDRLRDTATSHKRITIVEIMGRHCGDLALYASVACGCEAVIVPEHEFSLDDVLASMDRAIKAGKRSAVIALCENVTDLSELTREIEAHTGFETRATVLGHIVRGGVPTAFDRVLGSRLGAYAVDLLRTGMGGRMVGVHKGELVNYDFSEDDVRLHFDEKLYQLSALLV